MYCWYCYWGWPLEVATIYDKHLNIAGYSAMHYDPSHIVWEDENFERHHVQWCLDNFDSHKYDYTEAELVAVKQSLEDLLTLPDSILSPMPDSFDGSDPAAYPPADHLGMTRR